MLKGKKKKKSIWKKRGRSERRKIYEMESRLIKSQRECRQKYYGAATGQTGVLPKVDKERSKKQKKENRPEAECIVSVPMVQWEGSSERYIPHPVIGGHRHRGRRWCHTLPDN